MIHACSTSCYLEENCACIGTSPSMLHVLPPAVSCCTTCHLAYHVAGLPTWCGMLHDKSLGMACCTTCHLTCCMSYHLVWHAAHLVTWHVMLRDLSPGMACCMTCHLAWHAAQLATWPKLTPSWIVFAHDRVRQCSTLFQSFFCFGFENWLLNIPTTGKVYLRDGSD